MNNDNFVRLEKIIQPEYRVCCVIGNLWCAQVRLAEKGSREVDCWYSIGRAMPRDEAMAMATSWAIGNRKVDLSILDGSPEFRAWVKKCYPHAGYTPTILDRIAYMRTV